MYVCVVVVVVVVVVFSLHLTYDVFIYFLF
jgi:hypothetical protein